MHNLSPETSPDDLYELFNGFTDGKAADVRKIKNFAFVDFETLAAAEAAVAKTAELKPLLHGREVVAKWSQHQNVVSRQLLVSMCFVLDSRNLVGLLTPLCMLWCL